MSVNTNAFTLQVAAEDTLGVLPVSPSWFLLEPNGVSRWGAEIATVARDPISKNRQARKGVITDLDSGVTFDHDMTMDVAEEMLPAFVMADRVGAARFVVTGVTSTGYTVASGGALAQNTLIFARGFATAANNGFKVVGASSTGTEIKTSGLTTEAAIPAAQNASVEVCGFQFASGDLEMNSSGNLITTTKDLTQLGLRVGQTIVIGGDATGERFATAVNNGRARVVSVAANLLTLSWRSGSFSTDNGSGKTVQLFFGSFLRNVPVDDGDFAVTSYQFEGTFPNLTGGPYQYAKGNYCNEFGLSLPLTDKATCTLGFIGTTTDNPTASQATNADAPRVPRRTAAFSTASSFAELRVAEVDETALTTYFKSATLNLTNNVAPEKVLNTLGAAFMNYGNFGVTLDTEVLFESSGVIEAIRANETVSMRFMLMNQDDGGFLIDLPSMTLGGGAPNLPRNETVKIGLTGQAFQDSTLGYTMSVSYFPYLPERITAP